MFAPLDEGLILRAFDEYFYIALLWWQSWCSLLDHFIVVVPIRGMSCVPWMTIWYCVPWLITLNRVSSILTWVLKLLRGGTYFLSLRRRSSHVSPLGSCCVRWMRTWITCSSSYRALFFRGRTLYWRSFLYDCISARGSRGMSLTLLLMVSSVTLECL